MTKDARESNLIPVPQPTNQLDPIASDRGSLATAVIDRGLISVGSSDLLGWRSRAKTRGEVANTLRDIVSRACRGELAAADEIRRRGQEARFELALSRLELAISEAKAKVAEEAFAVMSELSETLFKQVVVKRESLMRAKNTALEPLKAKRSSDEIDPWDSEYQARKAEAQFERMLEAFEKRANQVIDGELRRFETALERYIN